MDVNKIIRGDCLEELKKMGGNSIDAVVTDPPAGISFMGKEWDENKGGRDNWIKWMTEVMAECLRVLKPGAHALVWALPRTSHWTTTAIENAGFEVRDVVHHIFNTGFPKSLNVGKAVDKRMGNKREVVGEYKTHDIRNAGLMDKKGELKITKTQGTSPYEGFGTALKPACEHWILARKPLAEKTVAGQVLKTGTGGLDIDGTRIPTKEIIESGRGNRKSEENWGMKPKGMPNNTLGRFPADVIVQDDALNDGMIEKDTGHFPNVIKSATQFRSNQIQKENFFEGSGSKSRYFDIDLWAEKNGILQIPKAAKSEKNRGLEDMPNKKYDGRFNNGGEWKEMEVLIGKNNHPTVKSITLMSWLIKLISKEDDIVLDPFAGSGTTLVAAKMLNRKFIGIEKEKDYCQIGEARLNVVPKTLV